MRVCVCVYFTCMTWMFVHEREWERTYSTDEQLECKFLYHSVSRLTLYFHISLLIAYSTCSHKSVGILNLYFHMKLLAAWLYILISLFWQRESIFSYQSVGTLTIYSDTMWCQLDCILSYQSDGRLTLYCHRNLLAAWLNNLILLC